MFGDPYQNFGWGNLLDQWNGALEVARAAFQQQQQQLGGHMPGAGQPAGGAGGLGDPMGTQGLEMARGAPSGSAVAPGLPSPLAPGAGSHLAGDVIKFPGAPPKPIDPGAGLNPDFAKELVPRDPNDPQNQLEDAMRRPPPPRDFWKG